MISESMVFAIARSAERLLADATFGVSLVLGWNLFRIGVLKDQAAELSGHGWKFRLQRVGPGIFFALFGAVGLVVALQRPLQMTVNTSAASSADNEAASSSTQQINYAESNDSSLPDFITALTTVEYLGIQDNGVQSAQHDALLKAKPVLEARRQALLQNVYPDYRWYVGVRASGGPGARKLSTEESKRYNKMDEIVNRTLIANP